jgi:hypothetical protein
MKKTKAICLILLSGILVTTMLSNVPLATSQTGPREDDLLIIFYGGLGAAYGALTTGGIDMVAGMGWSCLDASAMLESRGLLDANLYAAASTNPNIVLAPVHAANMYEFDLNNNYTIPQYPGVRSPMNYTEMRQAIAFLTNKDYYVNVFCGGLAERIDQMIPAPFKGWGDASMWYPNYPYEYNPAAAKALLDSKFPEGTTPNPYYDPANPYSARYWRTYPADHTLAGQDLDPLIVVERIDDTRLWSCGIDIANQMTTNGIPLLPTEEEGPVVVTGARNYHLYTGSWTAGRFPPTTLYHLFHSVNTLPGGANYVTGNGTHPYLDELLSAAKYAATYSEAISATHLACGYMTEICVNIPLWSDVSYCAYSRKLLGVVNMEGYGPINPFTFMNAYKIDNSAIRIGLINAPALMNIVYSDWVCEILCLDRMNLYSGIEAPPYNLAADQAGFIRDWETTTWNNGTKDLTLLRQTYRSDAYFCKPVSGALGENVNATCYFWNAWYDYQVGDGWFSTRFKDLHHIDITGEYSSDSYFTTCSYFNTYYCQCPLKPMDTWGARPELVTKVTESVISVTTPGPVLLSDLPTWFEYVTFDGTPLTLGTDYNIVEGQLYIYASLGTGTVNVKYWAPNNPQGITPGDLPWTTIFEGAGMYYATAFTYGRGGSLTLKRNPSYYMETPQLGEIDFVRKSNGAYKIDIFDLALAGGAYTSQGILVPSPNWWPGADIAPFVGIIDINDATTVVAYWDVESDPPS